MSNLPPAINGTEQRLDVVIAELRGLRSDMAKLMEPAPAPAPAVTVNQAATIPGVDPATVPALIPTEQLVDIKEPMVTVTESEVIKVQEPAKHRTSRRKGGA